MCTCACVCVACMDVYVCISMCVRSNIMLCYVAFCCVTACHASIKCAMHAMHSTFLFYATQSLRQCLHHLCKCIISLASSSASSSLATASRLHIGLQVLEAEQNPRAGRQKARTPRHSACLLLSTVQALMPRVQLRQTMHKVP